MKHDVRTLIFAGLHDVVTERAEQEIAAGCGRCVIQTHYSCISAGTELAKLTGLQKIDFPSPMGNRAVGRVVEAGEGAAVAAGDLIFAHTYHVSHAEVYGMAARLPDALDVPAAATLGMAMVAITGVRTAQPELGDTCVVTGAGLVGQFAAQLMQMSGAKTILVDPCAGRLAVAKQCGVEHTAVVSGDEAVAAVMDVTGGLGADFILECTGNTAVVEGAIAYAANSATMVLVGSPRGQYDTDLTPFLHAFHLWGGQRMNMTLKGAHEWKIPLAPAATGYCKHSQVRNVRQLAEWMLSGKLKVDPLLSRVYDPDEPMAAYVDLLNSKDEVLGAVFDWTRGGEE